MSDYAPHSPQASMFDISSQYFEAPSLPRDRRRDQRYPVQLAVRYKAYDERGNLLTGETVTSDISSGGVCLQGEMLLPLGAEVELGITWPFRLEGVCRLKLVVFGRVVRRNRAITAIKTQRYEFRTAGINALA